MIIGINVNIEAKGLEAAILKLAGAFENIGIGFEVDQHLVSKEQTVSTEKPELTFTDAEKVSEASEKPVEAVKEEKVVNPTPEPVKAPESASVMPEPQPEPEQPKKAVTRQELFTRCTQLVQGKKVTMDFMTKALQKFGAVSLPSLTDEQVPLFWEELDKAGV